MKKKENLLLIRINKGIKKKIGGLIDLTIDYICYGATRIFVPKREHVTTQLPGGPPNIHFHFSFHFIWDMPISTSSPLRWYGDIPEAILVKC